MKNRTTTEIWAGAEELTQDPAFLAAANEEFGSEPLIDTLANENKIDGFTANRRDFLKYMGFGLGAATIAASCEIPVRHAIPYVTKPDTIVPGVANYYASSFVQGGDYCAILVKTREGRPIKIEGNDLSKVTMGGTSARAQAAVLGLYDINRIQSAGKIKGGELTKMEWSALDTELKNKLAAGGVRIVTNTVLSPTTKKVFADFVAKFPNSQVVTYDAVSASAILLANEISFGDKVVPSYRFQDATVIVSFDADFLGTWISPIEYAAQYAKNRKISLENPTMSRHIQVESHMSLTGSNADNRILVKPSEQGVAIAALYNEIAALTGGTPVAATKVNAKAAASLKKVAAELVAARGKGLVVAGSNNVNEQVLVNGINAMIGSLGTTIDFAEASMQRQGLDSEIQGLVADMNSGAAKTVIFFGGANPCFDLPNAETFATALKKVPTKVSFSSLMDETTSLCDYAAPDNHFLESWGDAQPKRGHYSLIQPTIAPVFKTRQAEETLLTWATAPVTNYHDYLQANWTTNMMNGSGYQSGQTFWDSVLHDGVLTVSAGPRTGTSFRPTANAGAGITKPLAADKLEISFFETVNIGAGQYANNPWLQEMPDPVGRTVWGNYLAVPITFDGINDFDGFNDLKDGDTAEIEVNGKKVTATVIRQFGQMPGTVAIALGYGRTAAGLCGTGVGANVQNMLSVSNGQTQYFGEAKVSAKNGTDKEFASVQYHHTMGVTAMGKEEGAIINADEKSLGYKGFQGSLTDRSIIRKTNIDKVKEFVTALGEERAEFQHLNAQSIYGGHEDKYSRGHHWGMYVDLNGCTGCGACTVACMSENNVPVVGKHEVHRHHEMSWLRIDRYYYGDVENPSVVYQPMMCQHCDNAPCENVCPVNATSHSAEGLNQMTYNRCIGTRYCANNCPYKVRRFNWLDYTTADMFGMNERSLNGETDMPYGADNLTRMVLNPDVTVRTRGVIEKCSFCVQRIQEGKLTAKKEQRQLRDADIKTACQTACPTGAIVFGDRNNPDGTVSKMLKSPLNYMVLEEVNVASNILYSAKVTNRKELV